MSWYSLISLSLHLERYYELEDQLPSQSLGTSISQLDSWRRVTSLWELYPFASLQSRQIIPLLERAKVFPGFPLASLCLCGSLCLWSWESLLKAEEQLLNASQKGTLADKLRVSWSNLALRQKHIGTIMKHKTHGLTIAFWTPNLRRSSVVSGFGFFTAFARSWELRLSWYWQKAQLQPREHTETLHSIP